MKAVSWFARDWSLSGLLRYQSGQLIRTPASNNNLLTELGVGTGNNPALWGGGTTFQNRVPGQPLFLVNPNSHFDPTSQLGAESGRLDRCAGRTVRCLVALLQRLPLATSAG